MLIYHLIPLAFFTTSNVLCLLSIIIYFAGGRGGSISRTQENSIASSCIKRIKNEYEIAFFK